MVDDHDPGAVSSGSAAEPAPGNSQEADAPERSGQELTAEELARFERLRWGLSQSRQAVGWALGRATGWGPVPEVAGVVRNIAGWVRPSGPLRIDGYRSFGRMDQVRVRGRVLASPDPGSAREGEHSLRSAGRMASRFLSSEVAGVTVEVCYGGIARSAATDDEGYFSVDFELDRPSELTPGWSLAQARVLDPEAGAGRWWPIEVLVIGADVDRIIVSDVDDTILLNGVGAAVRTVLTTISGSALTREAVPGAADAYRQLSGSADDGSSPRHAVFYVSSSPWNLYDFLVAFLAINRFPAGPLLLRDIGLSRRSFSHSAHRSHKTDSINDILDRLPAARVVLIGDSSLQDAHAFAEVIDAHPGRIEAVFLRDVGDEERTERTRAVLEERRHREPPMILVTDMAEIAARMDQV